MNTLNNSVIICDTPKKLPKKKVSLGTRKEQKGVKKTFYESPLKHIQLSKRWKQIQAQRKLMKDAKQIINNKKNSSLLIKEASFQDSIIILSDNESESSNQNDQSNCTKKRKRTKTQEILVQDDQNSQCSHDSNKSMCQSETEIEKCPKRRKKNSVLSDPNATCLLLSDTEDSEIVSVDLDNENIAPASGSLNQSSDDIVVVWSSKKSSPLSTNYSGGEKPLTEEENKIFMVDCCPNPENLSLLECNQESTSNECEENTEVKKDKGTEDNEDTSDEEQDPKYLPFSKKGLRLPKAHNISKTLKIKRPKRKSAFLQYRRMMARFSNKRIPVTCTQTASKLVGDEPFQIITGVKVTKFQPPRFEQPRFEPPRFELSNFEPPRVEPPRIEPPRVEPSTDELFGLNPSRVEPASSNSSEKLRDESASSNSSKKLREIIIDGNNVAMAYKNNRMFCEEGIMLVMDYFQRRGHDVKVFIPQYRRSRTNLSLEKLYKEGVVIFTPSRKIGGRSIVPYDDRFILEYATVSGGIVISSDQYRDLYREKPEWRDTIENRLLAPTFVGNYVMFPEDPLGRNGPNLDEFLRH
ncbi:NEDD4-binding protein 1-like isoform X2 [Osmia bicornis bicornis]|uniref:NEDD4-binding protein 1-like isoform X2 n=1 Tax=Osmia bicornis bicornis TaxID=1437191 RepID=UPI0010F66845|nr:NEDD4-binding protein 1-like isoform X2 [Osmia bicornis bicornis]